MKKFIAIILAVTLCLSSCAVWANAEEIAEDTTPQNSFSTSFKTWYSNLYINFWNKFDSVFGDIDPTVRLNLRCDGKQIRLGTWLWNTEDVATELGDKYLEFLTDNGVNEIYLYGEGIGYNVTADQVRAFVKKANKVGIRCAFLAGEPCWLDDNDTSFAMVMNIYEQYQASSDEDEKFYGIHLDLEPAQRADYAENPQRVMQKFAEFLVNTARYYADRNDTVLEWDIHRFLNEFTVNVNGEQMNLLECFTIYCDTLILMSYSDEVKGMFKFTSEEFKYAKKHKTCLFLASETGTMCSDEETYAQEGQRAMVRALTKVNRKMKKEFEYGEYGIAVHHVAAWYNLQSYKLP